MKIVQIKERNTLLLQKLLDVWESSVKATHLFLSAGEINNIKQYVPQALKDVPVLVIAENDNENPIGFMGIADKMLEMLFVSNEYRGQGAGKQLLQYGIENYSINEQGSPYPLLYMKRNP